jgi:hypothetical protein
MRCAAPDASHGQVYHNPKHPSVGLRELMKMFKPSKDVFLYTRYARLRTAC